jgi:electron-transferring-flavoprotein dehydrogenase
MSDSPIDRQTMDVDVVCVGFGPAMGGFLTTLSRELMNPDGTPRFESKAAPGLPLQVICYERADDIGFGVSGVVTKARGIRASFPDLDPALIPMAANVGREKVLYLLDPIGASRRSTSLRAADKLIRTFHGVLPFEAEALDLPYTPDFLHKKGGLVLSIGQFTQWVGQQVMASGAVQVWPGTPVSQALIEEDKVVGVRLVDQGTDKAGNPDAGFMPGMDIKASLTVVGDGPFGPVGRQLDEHFGMPPGHHSRDWAVGSKMVIGLPETSELEPGTVFHTFGYPEPEIFGFLYVHPGRVASVGIFVPSWFSSPVRTSYRYLQHFIQHPYLWRYLKGGSLRSWGAKTIAESGRIGEPHLALDGCARIGEGSGSTNVLTGSGVDEAWTTGTALAEGVLAILGRDAPFTKANLLKEYVSRRQSSWVESEAKVAERARVGFHKGLVTGLVGMALAGLTKGAINIPGEPLPPHEHITGFDEYYRGKLLLEEIASIRRECLAHGTSVHDALMERAGWPAVAFDGQLLVSHQDALLMGGKVQASAGYADHVVFLYPNLCETCGTRICVEICSGEAITASPEGQPQFDREKCIHCGACVWNCEQTLPGNPEKTNIEFRAGAGGLHSTEN